MEIEAIDVNSDIGQEKLHEQCTYYLNELEINPDDLISGSYSDLLNV